MTDYILGFDSRYWNGVLPQGYDYKFVYIKATEGESFVANTFHDQWLTRLKKGAYHFWRHNQDAKLQARHFYNTVYATGDLGDLPPVVDFEDGMARRSQAMVRHIKECLWEVENLFRQKPMIYTGAWWWDQYVYPYQGTISFDDYDLWVAHYTNHLPQPRLPLGFTHWEVWQYIGDWSAPGFNAGIDVNRTTFQWFSQYTDPPQDTVADKLRKFADDLIDIAEGVTRCADDCDDHA